MRERRESTARTECSTHEGDRRPSRDWCNALANSEAAPDRGRAARNAWWRRRAAACLVGHTLCERDAAAHGCFTANSAVFDRSASALVYVGTLPARRYRLRTRSRSARLATGADSRLERRCSSVLRTNK